MTAETYAICVALEYLRNKEIHDAVIFTDSLSSLQLIESELEKPKRNSIIQKVIEMASTMRTTLQWVPSHMDIK